MARRIHYLKTDGTTLCGKVYIDRFEFDGQCSIIVYSKDATTDINKVTCKTCHKAWKRVVSDLNKSLKKAMREATCPS